MEVFSFLKKIYEFDQIININIRQQIKRGIRIRKMKNGF